MRLEVVAASVSFRQLVSRVDVAVMAGETCAVVAEEMATWKGRVPRFGCASSRIGQST